MWATHEHKQHKPWLGYAAAFLCGALTASMLLEALPARAGPVRRARCSKVRDAGGGAAGGTARRPASAASAWLATASLQPSCEASAAPPGPHRPTPRPRSCLPLSRRRSAAAARQQQQQPTQQHLCPWDTRYFAFRAAGDVVDFGRGRTACADAILYGFDLLFERRRMWAQTKWLGVRARRCFKGLIPSCACSWGGLEGSRELQAAPRMYASAAVHPAVVCRRRCCDAHAAVLPLPLPGPAGAHAAGPKRRTHHPGGAVAGESPSRSASTPYMPAWRCKGCEPQLILCQHALLANRLASGVAHMQQPPGTSAGSPSPRPARQHL